MAKGCIIGKWERVNVGAREKRMLKCEGRKASKTMVYHLPKGEGHARRERKKKKINPETLTVTPLSETQDTLTLLSRDRLPHRIRLLDHHQSASFLIVP